MLFPGYLLRPSFSVGLLSKLAYPWPPLYNLSCLRHCFFYHFIQTFLQHYSNFRWHWHVGLLSSYPDLLQFSFDQITICLEVTELSVYRIDSFIMYIGSSADRKVYPHQPMMFWRSGLTIERVWIAWESSETCQWTDRLDDFGYKGDEKGCAFFEWGGLDWVNVALLDLRGVIRGRRLVISASLADLNRLNCIVGGKVVSYWSSKGEEQSDWAIVDLYKRVCRLMRDGGRES